MPILSPPCAMYRFALIAGLEFDGFLRRRDPFCGDRAGGGSAQITCFGSISVPDFNPEHLVSLRRRDLL